MKRFRYIFLLLSALFIFSCKKREDGNKVLFKFQIPSEMANGRNLSVSKLKIYFSNFMIYNDAGDSTLIKDVILVKNPEEGFSFVLPRGNYKKLVFDFGLNKILNSTDPTTISAAQPLSLEQDMYWGMIKYRFLVIEGNIDSTASKSSAPNTPYSIHLGTDTLWRQITFNDSLRNNTNIEIHLNLQDIFKHAADAYNPLDYGNQSTTSDIPQAISITNNFVNGITVQQVAPN